MFVEYYGLSEDPFSGTRMPRYPYLGASYREALAALHYGLERHLGFQLLIGERGTGKTTLLRQFQGLVQGEARTLFLSAKPCGALGFLHGLLGGPRSASRTLNVAAMHERIEAVLSPEEAPQKRLVLLLDDAHNLDDSELVAICSLESGEKSERGWLQLVLATSPAIVEKSTYRDAMQFYPPVWIERLAPAEVEKYIDHRIRLAGWTGGSIFSADACAAIAQRSKGIPTKINQLCSRALQTGSKGDTKRVDVGIVDVAMDAMDPDGPSSDELRPDSRHARPRLSAVSMAAGALILVLIIVASIGLWYGLLKHTHPASGRYAYAPRLSAMPADRAGDRGTLPQLSPNRQPSVAATNALAKGALEPIHRSGGRNVVQEDSAVGRSATVSSKRVGAGNERSSAPASGSDARVNGEQLSLAIKVGDADMRRGEYDQAIRKFRHALALVPGNELVKQRIARARRAKAVEEDILQE